MSPDSEPIIRHRNPPLFRRRKLPTVRLGGRRRWGFFLRRVKLRSWKVKLRGMVKRVKKYCRDVAKDVFLAGGDMDGFFHDAVLFDTAFAMPVMSLGFNHQISAVSHRRTTAIPSYR